MPYRAAALKVRTGARRKLEVTSRELIDLCRSDIFAGCCIVVREAVAP